MPPIQFSPKEKGGPLPVHGALFLFHLRWVSPRARVLREWNYFYNYFCLFIKGDDFRATGPSLTVSEQVSRNS